MFITEYGAIRLYKIRWMENLAYGDSARLYLHHPLHRRDLPVIRQGEDARWGEGDVQGGLMAGLFRTFNDSREPERVLPADTKA
jgi:hypothetical protein